MHMVLRTINEKCSQYRMGVGRVYRIAYMPTLPLVRLGTNWDSRGNTSTYEVFVKITI